MHDLAADADWWSPVVTSLLYTTTPECRKSVGPCCRRPNLAAGAEEWNPMVASVLVATAGLFKYLGDMYPPDLPEYDPV